MNKVCRQCNEEKPLTDFGDNAANLTQGARDGKNIVCRRCIRERVTTQRRNLRRYKKEHQLSLLNPDRKPLIRIHNPLNSPIEIVKMLIKQGNHTRESIQLASRESGRRLSEDEVSDALAVLNCEQGVVKFKRVNGEARFFLAKIA